MIRYRVIIATVTLGVGLATAAGVVYAQAGSPPVRLSPQYVARDTSGSESLAVQLQQGVRNTGAFDFTLAGIGTWAGVIPIRPTGPRIIHLQGVAANVKFQAAGTGTTAPATVRMEGQIDQSHNSAVVNIWVTRPQHPKPAHHLLKTSHPDIKKAPKAAQKAGGELAARNWPALYDMAASAITQRYTQAQFVHAMKAQHQPGFTGFMLAGPGQSRFTAGITYFIQPFSFTTKNKVHGHTAFTADMLLVWEQSKAGHGKGHAEWHFAGTTAPSP